MRADIALGAEQLNVINSEIAIIRSNTVINATADNIEEFRAKNLKAAPVEPEEPSSRISEMFDSLQQWMLDVGLREVNTARDVLIRDLEDGLKVEPKPSSNVIAISYNSDNPEMAAFIVNAATENYINHHLKVFSSIGTSEVYRLQIQRLEKDMDKRRKELADYKRDRSVSALNETKRAQVRKKSELTTELSNIERTLEELSTRFGKKHTKVILAEERKRVAQQSLDEITDKLISLELEEAAIREMSLGIGSIEKTIQSYTKRYQDEQIVNLANPDVINVLIIEKAVAPTRPGHSRLFYIILATIGGLLLSLAIAFIKEYFDHRVTDPEEASKLLAVPTLGSIEKV